MYRFCSCVGKGAVHRVVWSTTNSTAGSGKFIAGSAPIAPTVATPMIGNLFTVGFPRDKLLSSVIFDLISSEIMFFSLAVESGTKEKEIEFNWLNILHLIFSRRNSIGNPSDISFIVSRSKELSTLSYLYSIFASLFTTTFRLKYFLFFFLLFPSKYFFRANCRICHNQILNGCVPRKPSRCFLSMLVRKINISKQIEYFNRKDILTLLSDRSEEMRMKW